MNYAKDLCEKEITFLQYLKMITIFVAKSISMQKENQSLKIN